jgi:hypothetical protein
MAVHESLERKLICLHSSINNNMNEVKIASTARKAKGKHHETSTMFVYHGIVKTICKKLPRSAFMISCCRIRLVGGTRGTCPMIKRLDSDATAAPRILLGDISDF